MPRLWLRENFPAKPQIYAPERRAGRQQTQTVLLRRSIGFVWGLLLRFLTTLAVGAMQTQDSDTKVTSLVASLLPRRRECVPGLSARVREHRRTYQRMRTYLLA